MISQETQIDLLRCYLHFASEYFGRKNLLEAIRRWKKEKQRKQSLSQLIPFPGMNQPKIRKGGVK